MSTNDTKAAEVAVETAPIAKPAPIHGKATVTTDSKKPHISQSAWTVDTKAKSATADYLGGVLTITRNDAGALVGSYLRAFTEEEGAAKEGEISMQFTLHNLTLVEAQDRAEQVVRDNLSRSYGAVLEIEDAKVTSARVEAAGEDPF
ncbi:hypothetical protein CcrColossus_gp202 [Caulobacter phage CcrColossus]|uniref:Uncharacterized protein n=1 Tax=Caulobacter phage CcrColossus TaxID=1211640 RepID=K4K6B5_9CAUD|nr:hypothetical protein CcrColossus_gp202 [Caulobacter phage CcrColossus]AFU88072.1 hypothetical protein CcrColossus_gp202 [Caulobacter phage CcrColossus]